MKKSKHQSEHGQAIKGSRPAARLDNQSKAASHHASQSLQCNSSPVSKSLLSSQSINDSPLVTAQSKVVANVVKGTSSKSQRKVQALSTSAETLQALTAYKDSSTVDHDEILSDADKKSPTGKAKDAEKSAEHLETGMEAYSAGDEFVGAVTHDSSALSIDDMEWKDDGTKRSDKEQAEWLKKNGHSSADVEKLKAEEATKGAVTGGIGTGLSFLKVPAMWQKFKKAEDNYERFTQVLEGASLTSGTVATGAKVADAASSGKDQAAQDTSSISEYTGGIIDLVKSAYKSCLALKDAREDYLLIKKNADKDPSKLDAAKIAFEGALSLTSGILSSINTFQKSFGSAQNLAIASTVPAIGIAMSAISMMNRFLTVMGQEEADLGKTAEASQADAILASVKGDDNKAKVKQVLENPQFRLVLRTMAEYRQQERDNPLIFAEFKKAEGDPALDARLRKRYPKNYERISRIRMVNQVGIHDADVECQKLVKFGVSKAALDAVVEDQTLIDHLQEIKAKRKRNAKIGIVTDLINIGADIAILSGAGATAGAAMKAGTAAVDVARKGGNAIKFAARLKGAEDFSKGAKGGFFGGVSMFDQADILKSEKAKQERYFHSSKLLLDNMADHDRKAEAFGDSPSEAELKANESSYQWVEAKVLGTGASVTLVKAMLNSGSKTGNDIVKYFMEKMTAR